MSAKSTKKQKPNSTDRGTIEEVNLSPTGSRIGSSISLTTRLSLFFTALACVVLLALGWLIGAAIEQHFEEQDRHALSGKLELAQHIIERVETAEELSQLTSQLSDALVGHHDLMIQILDKDQREILASDAHRFPSKLLHSPSVQADLHQLPLHQWQSDQQFYRGLVTQFPTKNPAFSPITVAIATDIAHHQSFMQTFMRTLWLFVAGAALVFGVLAWFAASRGLRPLRSMARDASEITANRLNQRLSLEAFPAELADLAEQLNQMLARLEEAFQRLSDFSSDLAHELRTPISNLMMQTQVSLSQVRDAQSYREILESNAEEYARLASMISDMLFLAKAEHGAQLAHCEAVDLKKEILALFDFYDMLAEDKQIRFALQCDNQADLDNQTWIIEADKLMLRRAFSNILSNALRHAHRDSVITVNMLREANTIRIDFRNHGDTIAPAQLTRLFERFYRVDHARKHNDGEGAGLGLAIVQAIVQGHHGSISATSLDAQTCFSLALPRSQETDSKTA